MAENLSDLLEVGVLSGWQKEPEIKEDAVLLQMFEYGIAGSRFKLKTERVYMCTGVVLYNPEIHVGILAHIPTGESFDEALHFLEYKIKQYTAPEFIPGFNAAIIGRSWSSSFRQGIANGRENEACVKTGNLVMRILQDIGFSCYNYETTGFFGDADISRDLVLDNSSGILTITGFPPDKYGYDKIAIELGGVNMASGEGYIFKRL